MTTNQPYGPPPGGQPVPPSGGQHGQQPYYFPGYNGPIPEPPKQKNWFLRHKVWTGIGVFVLLVIILGAIGGGGNNNNAAAPSVSTVAQAPSLATAPSATQLAKRAGCTHVGPWDTPEPPLYVAEIVNCFDPAWTLKNGAPDGDVHVDFLTFNNNAARDAWLQQAATFGDHGVIAGDRWTIDIPDALLPVMRVADEIANKAGGKIVL